MVRLIAALNIILTICFITASSALRLQQHDAGKVGKTNMWSLQCAVVTVVYCQGPSKCRHFDKIKNHYEKVDSFLAKPQNCTMVYIAAGGMTAKDVWNALGKQNIDQKTTFQETSSDGKSIPFQRDRTPTGQAILVGEWNEVPLLGLPEGVQRGSYGSKALKVCNPDTSRNHPTIADLRDDISYIDGTAWYGYPMLSLKLIQSFKLVLKIDLDVDLFRPMVFDLHKEMQGMAFAHTSKFCDKGDGPDGATFKPVKDEYVHQRGIQPASAGHKGFERGNNQYYSNFVVFNMSFFGSPSVVDYASFLHQHSCGFYWAGWTDQVLYASYMGMFLGPNFEDYTLDLSQLRCADDHLCWQQPKSNCRKNTIFSHGFLPLKTGQSDHPKTIEDWGQSDHPWKNLKPADGITFEMAMNAIPGQDKTSPRSCTGDNPPNC